MNVEIKECNENDFELVKNYISEFELDSRQLRQEEFLTMYMENRFVGFGRVREYEGFSEMCSTGILTTQRNKGFGSRLLKALEQKATQTIYLVCIIPSFFERLGFEVCTEYPREIKEKLEYCVSGLPVEEKYVVMTKRNNYHLS